LKRLALILGIFTLLIVPLSNAQQRWERNYGGMNDDWGQSVQQTSDGGYVVAGYTYSFGSSNQVYLIKTNAFGDTLWTKTYGGAGNDYGYSVRQTEDGGYIVAGYSTSFGNDYQVYLIKTDGTGDTLWTRTYGGANSELSYSIQQTSDGGYIIAGWTSSFGNASQVYLIKTDASGDTLWTRTYGGAATDYGYFVQQTSELGYIIAGTTSSFGNSDQVYLIKTNAYGDTLWTKTYGGADWDEGRSVQQTSDTGYIIAGLTYSYGLAYQVYLIKTNAYGDTLWSRNYGGVNSDFGYSVKQTSVGGYVVVGETYSDVNGNQVYFIKTDAFGDTLWTRTYGGLASEWGTSVQQTLDRGYIITGRTSLIGYDGQVYLIKTDADGNSGVEETAEVRGQRLENRITAKPNPFTSFATLPGHEAERFSLYDISGRKVGTFRGDRVGEELAPGVYFVCKGTACRAPTTAPLRIVKVR
jgi:hypothetical protein